jgi:hypothetical protein
VKQSQAAFNPNLTRFQNMSGFAIALRPLRNTFAPLAVKNLVAAPQTLNISIINKP